MELTGFHHLTAITAHAGENHQFYTQVLGMRLVKKTVNQDDVSAYHLFYGDGEGTPGSDITFFDWPADRAIRGNNSITRTGLRVPQHSLTWWSERFTEYGVSQNGVVERDGRLCLDFEDPEGQRLSLVADDTANNHPWPLSPVPSAHQVLGLGAITLTVPRLAQTHKILTEVMNMRAGRHYCASILPGLPRAKETEPKEIRVHVYQMAGAGSAAELHVAVDPSARPARQGAGGVHHVAFRTPTLAEYNEWVRRLEQFGVRSSGPIDRYYFRSLYFREPNGVLFEIATDGPGFAADEPLEELGQHLALPPFLEPHRTDIEARLKPI